MNQLKPYAFWIVSGVLLLVLLILGLFVLTPTDESIDGTSRDAYEVKGLLDSETTKLQQLSARAKRGDPNRVFDPQVQGDIDTLTKDYLLTEAWKGVIDPHVEKYELQLKLLRQDLIDRSAGLRKEIGPDRGKLPWYTAYQAATADLITRLRAAKALQVDETPSRSAAAATPAPAARPTTGPGAATASSAGEDPLDPKSGSRIRDVLGFVTTTSLPEQTEHPLLTTRFRVVEAVAGAVLASEAEALPNPLVGPTSPVRSPAAIVGWEWKRQDGPDALDGAIAEYATPVRCTVRLRGTESALLAALARLESLDRPVLIVLGSTLSRIERSPAGSRKPLLANGDAVVAPAALTVDLLILDFSQMPNLTSVGGETTPTPSAPPARPPGGMPPGFAPPGAAMPPQPSSDEDSP